MENTTAASPSVQKIAVDVIYIAIADKVRTDTESTGKPIHVEELGTLFPDMKSEEIVNHLTEMVKVERFQDVRVYISSSNAAYLYSDKYLPELEAVEKIVAEETQGQIAAKVREDSEKNIQLTAPSALVALFPDLEAERVQKYVTALLENTNYPDIRHVVGPTGLGYLYSVDHMTATYARLLARAEAKNPEAMIAETVREESQVYPRPTKVALFYEPLFQIEPDKLESVVESMLSRREYQDIKKIIASNGAIYLYSSVHMEPGFAERWVQWEEVEKALNP